jgi:hypothetical protein
LRPSSIAADRGPWALRGPGGTGGRHRGNEQHRQHSEPGQRRFHGPLSEVDGGDDNVSQAVGDEAVEQEEGYGVRGSRRQLRWSGGVKLRISSTHIRRQPQRWQAPQ